MGSSRNDHRRSHLLPTSHRSSNREGIHNRLLKFTGEITAEITGDYVLEITGDEITTDSKLSVKLAEGDHTPTSLISCLTAVRLFSMAAMWSNVSPLSFRRFTYDTTTNAVNVERGEGGGGGGGGGSKCECLPWTSS